MRSDMNVQFAKYSLPVAHLVNCHNRILCLYFDFAVDEERKKHPAIAVTPSSLIQICGNLAM